MELSPQASCTPVSLTLFSPAKVNLFFRVLKKREDNYHEIASLYQMISLGDTLRVCLAQEDKLTCSKRARLALFAKNALYVTFFKQCIHDTSLTLELRV